MAVTSNALNNASSTSIASTTQTFTISNSDNTGTSAASLAISVGGSTTSGDPKIVYSVTGATNWAEGIDNSASDSFKISASNALGTTDTLVITTTGVMTRPLQPCFLAYPSTTITDVTGDGTTYSIVYNSEVFDQGSNFASNTFTAPVTGKYYLNVSVLFAGLGAGNTSGVISLITSARTYSFGYINYGTMRDNGNFGNQAASFVCDMTAADTATVSVAINGGTKVVDIFGNAASTIYTEFSGFLIC